MNSELIDFNSQSAEKFKNMVKENDKKLYRHFKKYHIRFTKIYTDEEPFIKLIRLFSGRK